MRDWFNLLQTREKLVLIAGTALVVVVLGWRFLWDPPGVAANVLSESLVAKRQLLTNIQIAQSIVAERPQTTFPSNQSLIVLVDQTHRQYGLAGKLTRNQPDGPDGIRVSFQETPFDILLDWLGGLEANYAVSVEAAAINTTSQAGLVTATLVLRRP